MATVKQRKAIANALENGGNITKAMRDAGYSEATVNNPINLTKSNAWQDLMEAYLPDDMLLRALSDDIEAKTANRKAELELAFKLKGKMVEKQEINNPDGNLKTIIINKYAGGDKPTTETD